MTSDDPRFGDQWAREYSQAGRRAICDQPIYPEPTTLPGFAVPCDRPRGHDGPHRSGVVAE